jgi:hypothetical protein
MAEIIPFPPANRASDSGMRTRDHKRSDVPRGPVWIGQRWIRLSPALRTRMQAIAEERPR